MYIRYVQTSSSNHDKCCPDYVGTLLVEIYGYDLGMLDHRG
jgi:hypothetical protein